MLAAIIGVPVSALAYGFLKLVDELQTAFFTSLPKDLGFDTAPAWWPLPLLVVAGLLVALAIRRLPGTGGHSPADGFHAGGVTAPIELPGILLAALGTLSFGVVLGPEAPLILMGSGLGVLAVRLAARDAPPTATTVIAAAGSFAAISALLGSPLLGAFLLLEAAGIGGPMLGLVLVPGLLAAGIGDAVFVGLDSLTGFGTFSLAIPGLPPFGQPTGAMFGWAIVIGVVAAFLGARSSGWRSRCAPTSSGGWWCSCPSLGVLVARTGDRVRRRPPDKSASEVLFSGQSALPGLVSDAAEWSVGALLLLVVCKGLAYALSLSSFRGGPGLPGDVHRRRRRHRRLAPAGPRARARRRDGHRRDVHRDARPCPLTATLLATLLLGADGLTVMPLVIVAVVLAYVTSARLAPAPEPAPPTAEPTAAHPSPAAV